MHFVKVMVSVAIGVVSCGALHSPLALADQGFQPLADLKMPAPKLAAPRVSVRALGLMDAPTKQVIFKAYKNPRGAAQYVETAKELILLDSKGRTRRAIPIKGHRRHGDTLRQGVRVEASYDGRTIWLIYAAKAPARAKSVLHESCKAEPRIIPGRLESVSPDGDGVVTSSRHGLAYLKSGWKSPRYFPKDLPKWHPASACIHSSAITVLTSVGDSVISTYDGKLKVIARTRLKANCYLLGCVQAVKRTVLRCYEHRILGGMVHPFRNNLLVLDDQGKAISRLPLDHMYLQYLQDGKRLLLYGSSGDVTILDALKGDVLHHMLGKEVDGLKQYRVTDAVLVGQAVAMIWERDNFDRHTWPPRSKSRLLLIRDLAGKVLLHRKFKVKHGGIDPPLWARGRKLLIAWGDRIRVYKISR